MLVLQIVLKVWDPDIWSDFEKLNIVIFKKVYQLVDGFKGFSIGEKQILCLTRFYCFIKGNYFLINYFALAQGPLKFIHCLQFILSHNQQPVVGKLAQIVLSWQFRFLSWGRSIERRRLRKARLLRVVDIAWNSQGFVIERVHKLIYVLMINFIYLLDSLLEGIKANIRFFTSWSSFLVDIVSWLDRRGAWVNFNPHNTFPLSLKLSHLFFSQFWQKSNLQHPLFINLLRFNIFWTPLNGNFNFLHLGFGESYSLSFARIIFSWNEDKPTPTIQKPTKNR